MTKDENKKLADLRNKMGSIYTYLQLKEKIKSNSGDLKKQLELLADKTEVHAIETMNKIKEILDSFN
jgi:hypothetical protein